MPEAYGFFRHSLYMDLNDFKDNTAGGVHSACLGGTWMAVVYGFAGMRDYDGQLSFDPKLPATGERALFPLTVRGQVLEVDIRKEAVTYLLREGAGVVIRHRGEEIRLAEGLPVTVK